MDHSLPANTPCPPFLRKRSPDGATPEVANIQLQLTTHLSTPWDERLSWPGWLTYSGPVSYRSIAEQGKFAGQRSTYHRCATQTTLIEVQI